LGIPDSYAATQLTPFHAVEKRFGLRAPFNSEKQVLLYMMVINWPVCSATIGLARSIAQRDFGSLWLISLLRLQLIVCLTAAGALAQSRYKIVHIPTATGSTSAALGLNENGQVVGYSFQGDDYKTFLYAYPSGKIAEVGSLGGKLKAACAINNAGTISGYCQDGNGNLQAFSSSNGQIKSLGTFNGGATSEAFGINEQNEIVGDSATGTVAHRPFLYSGGNLQDLGIGGNETDAFETAYGISNGGIVIGRYDVGNGVFHAFQSNRQAKLQDLGTLGGSNSEALGLSKGSGSVIAGDSDTANGGPHACTWTNGNPTDLGVLPGFEKTSYARAVNNSNHAVGDSDSDDQKRAFLYENNHLYELDQLATNLDEAGFTSLDIAYGINDKDWICGYGTTKDGETHAFLAIPVEGSAQAEASDNLDVFYDQLAPQGDWCDCGSYGHVFRPRVPHGWRPYCNGHWVWTDRGWYWDSDDAFGWACFHYGRWIHEEDVWSWVPGTSWAPAWVSWRTGPEHCGWAPLPPDAQFGPGVGIGAWTDHAYGLGPGAYFFISFAHFTKPNYTEFILPPAQNVELIKYTVNVTNITANKNVINTFGPPVATVQQKTGTQFKPVTIVNEKGKAPGTNISNGVLKVTGPATTLKATASKLPTATIRNPNPVIDKGWKGVDAKTQSEFKTRFASEHPTPANLPRPTVAPVEKVLKAGALTSATPKRSATPFGASTPPSSGKGSLTGTKETTLKGGFNPTNPSSGLKAIKSATPKASASPTHLAMPTPTSGGHGGLPTPTPAIHLATPTPAEHEHSPTPHPSRSLTSPAPHHEGHGTPTPKTYHKKPESTGGGGGGGGSKGTGGAAAEHNYQPIYHPSEGGGSKGTSGGGAKGGGKAKPTPTPKKR
jgi:probable HAF family extracellular repeat protein